MNITKTTHKSGPSTKELKPIVYYPLIRNLITRDRQQSMPYRQTTIPPLTLRKQVVYRWLALKILVKLKYPLRTD